MTKIAASLFAGALLFEVMLGISMWTSVQLGCWEIASTSCDASVSNSFLVSMKALIGAIEIRRTGTVDEFAQWTKVFPHFVQHPSPNLHPQKHLLR